MCLVQLSGTQLLTVVIQVMNLLVNQYEHVKIMLSGLELHQSVNVSIPLYIFIIFFLVKLLIVASWTLQRMAVSVLQELPLILWQLTAASQGIN